MRSTATKIDSEDYRTIKAKLIERGYSLRRFAREHGYKLQTVYDAASGRLDRRPKTRASRIRTKSKTRRIRSHILELINQ